MSFDTLLLNLRILSKVRGGGRIARSKNGIISLEDSSLYLCVKRWLSWDSRHQTLPELRRIVEDASDKCHAMLNSKYMEATDKPEYRTLIGELTMLRDALNDARPGVENLRITYCQDYSTIAQLDLLLTKMRNLMNKISEHLPHAAQMVAEQNSEVIVADYKDEQRFVS